MEEFQELVYARLQTVPKNFVFSVGGSGQFTRDEALQHVKDNDEIGQLFIAMNREYFNALKSGELYECIS